MRPSILYTWHPYCENGYVVWRRTRYNVQLSVWRSNLNQRWEWMASGWTISMMGASRTMRGAKDAALRAAKKVAVKEGTIDLYPAEGD